MNDKIINEVSKYYSEKVLKNGITPQGVDWNSLQSQEFRFALLSEIIKEKNGFSILDYGCGFGAMLTYFKNSHFKNFEYKGFDISQPMIDAAKKLHENDDSAEWFVKLPENYKVDYVVASGIFNVKQETNNEDWKNYMLKTLHDMDQLSTKGFSFNVLTIYSDKEFMKDNLFYADPLFLFDYCKKNFSKYVALIHDYPLYEFTIEVKK